MKKKAPVIPSVIWFSWKLVITFSVALCILALLRLQSYSRLDLPSASLSRRLRPPPHSFSGPPKIAFLFLTRRNLPLDFLWGSFLQVFLSFYSPKMCLRLGKWLSISVPEWRRCELLDLCSLRTGICIRWIDNKVAFLFWTAIEE